MALITNAVLNAKINQILEDWIAHQDEFQVWIGGTVGGGAGLDGKYPLTDQDGTIRLTLCPAQLEDDVTGAVASAETAQTAAELAETNAAASAAAAVVTLSDTNTARTAAEQAETDAQTAESNAQTYANNASTSASAAAADAVSTAADAAATAADAIATAADAVSTAADAVSTAADVTYAAEWANKAEDSLVSAAAGGDEVDDYSALHWANKAAATAASIGTLDSLSDVTITGIASGELIKWNGSAWINQTLAEAGIEPADGTILKDADIGGSVQAYDADTAKTDVAETITLSWTFSSDIIVGNNIVGDSNAGGLIIYGGTSGSGANLELYGGTHATVPGWAVLDTSEFHLRDEAGGNELLDADVDNATFNIKNGGVVYVYDSTNAQYVSITHDTTEAIIDSSTGGVRFADTVEFANTSCLFTGASPRIRWFETGVTADEGGVDMIMNAEIFEVRFLNDAFSTATDFIQATRSLNTCTDLTLTATEISLVGVPDFQGGTSGTAGAIQGYINVEVAGTARRIPYYAV